MKVIFTSKRWSVASVFIRFITFSKYSHVGVILPDGDILHATLLDGVHISSREIFDKHYKKQYIVDVEVPDELTAFKFGLSQVGKPYDWKSLVGMFFQSRRWDDPSAWFCNELMEAMCKEGGRLRFRIAEVNRITPQQSWIVK